MESYQTPLCSLLEPTFEECLLQASISDITVLDGSETGWEFNQD